MTGPSRVSRSAGTGSSKARRVYATTSAPARPAGLRVVRIPRSASTRSPATRPSATSRGGCVDQHHQHSVARPRPVRVGQAGQLQRVVVDQPLGLVPLGGQQHRPGAHPSALPAAPARCAVSVVMPAIPSRRRWQA